MDKEFAILIFNKHIVLAIEDFDVGNFFDPVLWKANVKETLIRDFNLLSELVELAKIIAKIEIVETNNNDTP